MGLSRLDNFLKSVRGTIIYVDPNSIDSTDSIENQGNSLTRPFKTLQRALIEVSRFSYQAGLDNDRFGKTTILLYPGDHLVDNRPGWIPSGSNNYILRNGSTSNDFPPLDLNSNFDLTSPENQLYKMNSVHGGVIVPRGTSIVGLDLRKTRIRPLYVPDPENANIDRSAIFRVTGACYLWQFTVLDADPNAFSYKDYTTNSFLPNFSHHKLTVFEYADGVNPVKIDDAFLTHYTDRTDLQMYYEKVGLAYGQSSGRDVQPDYPSTSIDIQPKVDEYRIVGSRGVDVGISSIRAGDGVITSTTITVDLQESIPGLEVDTPIKISGVNAAGYNGQYVVSKVNTSTQIEYKVQNSPTTILPGTGSASLGIVVDTVTSASPYILNITIRSVFGMCSLLADGSKASGFKSMVVALFTGVGLQKDSKAFVKYNPTLGIYEDNSVSGNENISSDSLAVFKPDYANYHVKCINDAYLQLVSVFSIGYYEQFVSESGGDQSVSNSNCTFGTKGLVSKGFKSNAFAKDDVGYITHIIPPKVIESEEVNVDYLAIDVSKTVSAANNGRLYLYGQANQSSLPEGVVEGYRVGARVNGLLNVSIVRSGISTEYFAKIVMPGGANNSSEKKYLVGKDSVGVSSIASNTITFTTPHAFINGETVRVLSNNGHLPDGIESNQIYYAITSGVASNAIKLAKTLNDTVSLTPIEINNRGGILNIISRVSDKKPGDIGHPIQYDSSNSNWYVNVSSASTENTIYSAVVGLGTVVLGSATPRTYIKRKQDTRNVFDTVYRIRYVIPADSPVTASAPLDGYVIQESNTSIAPTSTEVAYQFNPSGATLANSTQLRNQKLIADATWTAETAKIVTELPHNLEVGSKVEILNIKSTNNTSGIANTAFNGTFVVAGISSTKEFSVALKNNPGTFANNTSLRSTSSPYFKKKEFKNTYVVYKSEEVQKYVAGERDGIYYLLVANASNSPTLAPFTGERYLQPLKNLYPQSNRDNPLSDPKASTSFALPSPLGQVVVDDPQNSITKETLQKKLTDLKVGIAITDIVSSSVGTAHTLYTKIDHGLNQVTSVSIVESGNNYGSGSGNVETYYNCRLVGYGDSTCGKNATARVIVSAAGTISNIAIMDGGSAYGIGNTMTVVGLATTAGFSPARLTVSKINSNIGDTLNLFGIIDNTYENYNSLYRIVGISTGASKEIIVSSASTISNISTTGVGVTIAANSNVVLTGKTLNVDSISYNPVTGLGTVTTTLAHGLNVNSPIAIGGASQSFYNGQFVVKQVVGLSTFVANFGISTSAPATSGTIFAYRPGFAAGGGSVNKDNENLGGRLVVPYAGITTTLSAAITSEVATTISISNVTDYNFQIGDYLQIDDEIMRIRSTVTSNPITVFRGVLGTNKSTHVNGSVVRRVNPQPIEFRRNSLIRASAHTFEYVGYGAGNYSTALPDKQNRTLSASEESLAQATRKDGGVVVFSAMNADGTFYTNNKKVNPTTGQEEYIDSPIQTTVGEDFTSGVNGGFNVLSPLEVSVKRSIRVDGGDDNTIISKFDGPVIFNNKISSLSTKGIEANSLLLQGDQSIPRKYTVGISTPTESANPGDVTYNAVPASNDYIGWVYTSNNTWEKFGYIGRFGVGISSSGSYVGFSTLLNLRSGVGATITSQHDSISGITTITFDASPLRVGVSTGLGLTKTFVGVATELNFVGYGVSIRAVQNAGIASITFDATGGGTGFPGAPVNSIQYNDGGFFRGSSALSFDGTNVFVGNAIGINSSIPSTKFDIFSTSGGAVRIRSTSLTGNILRIDAGSVDDPTPFVVDFSGNVGIHTTTPNGALDVTGNIVVAGGSIRIYESDRSNYIGLQVPTLNSNYTLTLPSTVGAASSVLRTTGSGVLDWVAPAAVVAGVLTSTDFLNEGSTNLYFTEERVQDAIGGAINSGIQTGISVTYDDTNNRINFDNSFSLYPYTTKGFNMPL
jgi:hypothetical protein